MRNLFLILGFITLIAAPVLAAPTAPVATSPAQERILGNPNAPIRVDEYLSLTCTHCADFYTNILPALKKTYVDTGKVKFILHDFPLDGIALKASSLARCMPADTYYAFISVMFSNQAKWLKAQNPEKSLVQLAKLGGLSEEKATACLNDARIQDTIATERLQATEKHDITATPTFFINGVQKISGAVPSTQFTTIFDDILSKQAKDGGILSRLKGGH